MPVRVFYVDGVPGAGKTWLCERLIEADIDCRDLDTVRRDLEHARLARTGMFGFASRDELMSAMRRAVADIVVAAARPVVFVGTQYFAIPAEARAYFIAGDPAVVYKQRVRRKLGWDWRGLGRVIAACPDVRDIPRQLALVKPDAAAVDPAWFWDGAALAADIARTVEVTRRYRPATVFATQEEILADIKQRAR